MKDKAHLSHIYCKVKNWIRREKQITQLDQDVHVYECGGLDGNTFVYDLSLSLYIFF